MDPGDLDPDSDPDPDPQHCSYVHIEFLGHKYSSVRNYEFFNIVITNLRVKTTLRNYA